MGKNKRKSCNSHGRDGIGSPLRQGTGIFARKMIYPIEWEDAQRELRALLGLLS